MLSGTCIGGGAKWIVDRQHVEEGAGDMRVMTGEGLVPLYDFSACKTAQRF